MYTNLKILFFLPTLLLTLGCSSPRSSRAEDRAEEKELRHASLLSLKDYGNATVAEIQNPWDSHAVAAVGYCAGSDSGSDFRVVYVFGITHAFYCVGGTELIDKTYVYCRVYQRIVERNSYDSAVGQ